MKKILVVDAHPDSESFVTALSHSYVSGAASSGAEVEHLAVRSLSFDPNLRFGYRKRTPLEPDLLRVQDLLKTADHIVFCYPVWWGSVPAVFKGLLDRVLLPGFAFKKRPGSLLSDPYLTGKTGRIICTLDQPGWYYRTVYAAPSHHAIRQLTFNFVGVRPVRITTFGPVRNSSEAKRRSWLQKVEKLGLLQR